VLENNSASKHILLKHGFKIIGSLPNFLTLNRKQLACLEFRLKYAYKARQSDSVSGRIFAKKRKNSARILHRCAWRMPK
jgi:hypothetical protein